MRERSLHDHGWMCVEWSFVAAYKVCSGVLVVVLGFFFFNSLTRFQRGRVGESQCDFVI